jgi:hypothetical protein
LIKYNTNKQSQKLEKVIDSHRQESVVSAGDFCPGCSFPTAGVHDNQSPASSVGNTTVE